MGTLLLGAQAGLLAPSHLIERLIEVLGNVERVEHIKGIRAHGGYGNHLNHMPG